MVKRFCLLVSVFVLAIQLCAFAGELYKSDVRQIYCFSDLIRVYTDIEDKDSNPIQKPDRALIAGYIDGKKLTTKSVNRFGDTGEGTADIFLVDVSGSMKNSQMKQVKNAIKTWANQMKGNDRIALIAFGDTVETLIDFSNDKAKINQVVDSLGNNANNTQLYGGIQSALKLATRSDKTLPKRKNIILISDGVNDYKGGISEADIYKELQNSLIPVYCMWMSNSRESNSKGLSTFNSVAQYSGGEVYDMSDKKIETVYGWIRTGILNTYAVDFSYDGIKADNNIHNFVIKTAQNDKIAEDTVNFAMKESNESSDTYKLTSLNSEEDEKEDNKESSEDVDNNTLLVVVLIALAFALVAGVGAFAMMLLRKDEEDYDGDIISAGNTSTFENNNVSVQSTVNVGYAPHAVSGVKLRFISTVTAATAEVFVDNQIIIGRNPGCDFVINNPQVSGNHAVISKINGELYLEDCGSVNGTLLNGRLINSKMLLKNGDILMFSNEEYRIVF